MITTLDNNVGQDAQPKATMAILLSHNVQSIQFLLVVIEKHIFYSYAKLFHINAVVIEMKAIHCKMLKWAFFPIRGAKRPHPFGTKRPDMGQNHHFFINNGHNQ